MSWFNTQGASPERILYSKVRYTRNVAKLPFGTGADPKKLADVYSRIDKILVGNGFHGERMASGQNAAVLSFAEKQLVDADLALSDGQRIVYLNEPCNLTVALGGSELISIQSVMSGRAVMEAKNSAALAEELLDGEITFAYSEGIGYLSARPELCGSCCELSAALFLPSLRILNCYEEARRSLLRRGAVLAPMFDHRDFAGDLYVVSYVPPHLANEEQAAQYFDCLIAELSSSEEKSQKMLFPDAESQLIDRACRALGLLRCSRRMSEDEMLRLISDIRLAISLNNDASLALPCITDLNFISVEGLDCALVSGSNQKCTSCEELRCIRADFLRKYISAKVKTEVGA